MTQEKDSLVVTVIPAHLGWVVHVVDEKNGSVCYSDDVIAWRIEAWQKHGEDMAVSTPITAEGIPPDRHGLMTWVESPSHKYTVWGAETAISREEFAARIKEIEKVA